MKETLDWLFSRYPRDKARVSESERLDASMKTTAANRYNAASRLKAQGRFTSFTTTILSLGLIFIPLMQLADVQLALPDRLLNAMQIFLAVSVLIYSIVIGTARYELRSEQLNDCGDNIRELRRKLRREKEAANGAISKEKLAELQDRYASITADIENHTRNDFRLAVLQAPEMFKITGIARLGMWTQYWAHHVTQFLPSLVLLAIELAFILEVFGVTTGLSHLVKFTGGPKG